MKFQNWLPVAVAAVGLAFAPAMAQSWPTKPVTWVVSYPAGGGLDFITRTVAADLANRVGQPVVVENRPGASGGIGAAHVAKAAPDGHTMITFDSGSYSVNPALFKNVQYDSKGDFTVVATIARIPFVLIVNPDLPAKTLAEFVAHAKNQPGKIEYGSTGIGNPTHLAIEMLQQRQGISLYHVPFKSAPDAVGNVVSGQIKAMFVDLASSRAFIQAGRVRALAVSAGQRIPSIPDVPTFTEAGLPNFEAAPWVALAVPKATPADVVERIRNGVTASMNDTETRRKLTDIGMEIFFTAGPAANQYAHAQADTWGNLVRALKLQVD